MLMTVEKFMQEVGPIIAEVEAKGFKLEVATDQMYEYVYILSRNGQVEVATKHLSYLSSYVSVMGLLDNFPN